VASPIALSSGQKEKVGEVNLAPTRTPPFLPSFLNTSLTPFLHTLPSHPSLTPILERRTSNVEPSTLKFQLSTLAFNHQFSIFNLQPSTFNLQPSTFNL
jgi:hypothetical protein